MRKAVFLDRDGVINKNVHHLNKVGQLKILPGAAKAIKDLNKLGFVVVVITNQSVIANGLLTEKGLDEIHAVLIEQLTKRGAKIDKIYYCSHHPEGTLKKYAKDCLCRKPGIGLVRQAQKDFQLSTKGGFFIGDMTSDILTGRRAKLKTILVKTGFAGTDGRHNITPDYVVKDLVGAVKIIKKSL
ncbi:MAG: HAD family hydrolase [Candidatus Zambryskibacteria bacterium]|nr:HAD family hydrolase [Candidatus Zambryskibacteria bacterium]